jgi:putative membrane protein
MEDQLKREKRFNSLITVISIAIPVVVAILFGIKIPGVAPLSMLPPIYATINGLTAVVLILAVMAIKNGQRQRHQYLMTTAIVFSLLFLLCMWPIT